MAAHARARHGSTDQWGSIYPVFAATSAHARQWQKNRAVRAGYVL